MSDSSTDDLLSNRFVVVEWVDDERTQYLPSTSQVPWRSRLNFEFAFDTSSNSAFCKLHFPLHTRSSMRMISLLIPPEQITALDLRHGHDLPTDVSRQLGSNVVRLRFDMKCPAVLVHDLIPKANVHYSNIMSLARVSTFTLYLSRLDPQTEQRLRHLCDALSSRHVVSIQKHADLTQVHHGKGCQVCADVEMQASKGLDLHPTPYSALPMLTTE